MHPSTAPRGPISSSAPPQFRVKKKRPDEAPQNNGRETGPPMQKGPGQGSMFADGKKPFPPHGNPPRQPMSPARPHGQPQFAAPPTPNYPKPGTRMPVGQHQGGKTMMADGQPPDDMIGSPSPVGGAPESDPSLTGLPVADDSQGPPPAAAGSGMPPIIKPESVNFHDQDQDCSGCMYFGEGNQCAVLQIQVSEESGCNAWEASGAPDQDESQGPIDTGAGFSQNDAGTSGAPSLS